MKKEKIKNCHIAPIDVCTGCTACFSVCPIGAISMDENKDGFLYPRIDKSLCINCGACRRVCPAINSLNNKGNFKLPKIFAGWNKNDEVRLKSSSGGIFSLLAENILNRGGYVCGVVLNRKKEVEHTIISQIKDLDNLRGSKYVQSKIGNNFKKVRELLDEDKWVLFSGTPCQVAGLKNFLEKEYSKLLLVDNVCHGVPSPGVYKKYLEEIEHNNGKKIKLVKFRDKTKGWKDPQFVLASDKSQSFVHESLFNNVFGRGFLTNLILRNSCTSCKYLQWPKVSDITLGDFWGIGRYDETLDDNKGTSMIMINSEKGRLFMDMIKKQVVNYKEIAPEVAINNNYPVLISSDQHVNRKDFFEEFSKGNDKPEGLILKYLDDDNWGTDKPENSVGILNFYYENYNFGANLIAYSLQTVINKIGYSAKIINYNPFPEQSVIEKACSINFYKFRQDFLNLTKICRTEIDLIKLNTQFDIFITGSDQVWRKAITGDNLLHYFLDFAENYKKMISYGASFGTDKWEGSKKETQEVKKLLSGFSAVSVREKSGLKILKDEFGVNKSESVLDPTLLLDLDDYERLIAFSDIDFNKDFIAFYFIFDKKRKIELGQKIQEIKEVLGLDLINIKGRETVIAGERRFVYESIPNFLKYIKMSKLVITDSYHGVLLSIIFQKEFLCIGKKSKSVNRFLDLFATLGLSTKERFFATIDDVSRDILSKRINYKNVYKKLKFEKRKSLDFLINSLKEDKKFNKFEVIERELIQTRVIDLDKINKLQNENAELQNIKTNLMLENEGLKNIITRLSSRKSIRYANKIGQILRCLKKKSK